MLKPKKVVLAYSGGLDTSVILKWLQDHYHCEIVTFTADLGQGEELEPARTKAIKFGIKSENIFIDDVREEFVRDSGGYFRRELPHRTVVHGDFRLDNLLFRGPGDSSRAPTAANGAVTSVHVGVVDFQTVTHACGAQDLAYFVGAGLTTESRRVHESELVQRWVDGLRGYNVALTYDDAWHEYRKFTFAGFVMAVVASMIVKQTDRGDEMFLAMANRHAQHAVDLDSLAAVRN